MKSARAIAIVLALIAYFGDGVVRAQSGCTDALSGDGSLSGEWSSGCVSESRLVDANRPRDGNYYAHYYTFSLGATSHVSITLESNTDTYMYLLSMIGGQKSIIAYNDDINAAAGNFNSRIAEALEPGDYIVEATTYESAATGEFTLTVSGIGDSESPPPVVDECIETIDADHSVNGAWTIDCLSRKRPIATDRPKDGKYYARYYEFSLSESSDVTITLESPSDSFLYILSSLGRDGAASHKNDDIDTAAGNYNSRIRATLQAGHYTIEATTFAPAVTGHFILSLDVQQAAPPPLPPSSADTDRAVLVALYNATDGDNWEHNGNWMSNAPLGEWHGVTTDSDGRVSALRLGWNNLSGGLPPEIGNLGEIRVILFNDNRLSGAIPRELGNLTDLDALDVGENRLTGEIPMEVGNLVNLTWLSFGSNGLTGTLPAEMGNLVSLNGLVLHANNLTGELPQSMTSLTNLDTLFFGDNLGLCVPDTAEFQAWLQSIEEARGTDCSDVYGWSHRPVFDGGIDLDVTYIERLPRYENYKIAYLHGGACPYPFDEFLGAVVCPEQDGAKRWSDAGETVELRAHVWNFGDRASGAFDYRWSVDDAIISSGQHSGLESGAHAEISLLMQWPGRESNPAVTFEVDPNDNITELLENNNKLVDWLKGHTIGFYFTPVAYQSLRLSNEPGQTIQSAEHWIHNNVSRLNEMLIEAGVEDRVRSELFLISENRDLSRNNPLRYYMGWWPTIDNPGSFFTSDGYRERPEIDWGLLHELLHQLGVIDLYQMGFGRNQIMLQDANRPGYFAGCGSDYWSNEGACYEFPEGINDIMSAGPNIIGLHTAGGLRSNTGHRRGFYGEYLYDTPESTSIRVVDGNDRALQNVALRFYQLELQSSGHIVDDIPEFTVTTDTSGIAELPNRGVTGIVTATGHQLKPNPFGPIDVVGRNGLFVIEMEGAACTNYEWLTVVELNLAYWDGQTDSVTFDKTLRCPPPSGAGAPSGIPAEAGIEHRMPPPYSPYSQFAPPTGSDTK